METKKITPSQVLRSKEYANILKATLMEIRASHDIPASKGLVFRRSIYEKTLSLLQQTQNINQNDKTDNHKEGD